MEQLRQQAQSAPTPVQTRKQSGWLWVVGIIAFFIVIGMMNNNKDKTPVNPAPESTPVPAATAPPKPAAIPWSQQALTAENIGKQLKDVSDYLKCEIDNGEVYVILNIQAIWDETSMIKDLGREHIDICQSLFPNKKVKYVTTVASTGMVDPYGKETKERVITLTWSRATFNKINIKNFRYMDDGSHVYRIADAYWIHPGVWKNYKNPEKLNNNSVKIDE